MLLSCLRKRMSDEVLERCLGIPIMLSLLFMSAARRVGLTLPPSSLPGHFMLRLEVGVIHVYVMIII